MKYLTHACWLRDLHSFDILQIGYDYNNREVYSDCHQELYFWPQEQYDYNAAWTVVLIPLTALGG